ncbi:deoxynucleoside kinase [Ferrimonas balearica DSM 9799]|uniref:Deoxynucleoside kinase n=1 Tax=Ferrimonas balearica (strain DSM 9799 / CCM 4581 / KCTC 23876 / PAT) TaxID=550540 RepID=E1SUB7_FERBD|nr:deoxynucleoside kinase [Ferrimonas balearica]ADN76250.1 deoxynucleoside kinase [Ferrimonas balearica DSM 9799]MBW3163250.1 deoxynucleoside kinase [Ferrimonas balearica]MBY5980946.1 deoxynucleoside kinase [Ferrimonas balearica]MBY6223198.1 deoxynucleoside kinase [Ferrimonas balearica]
MAQQFELVAIEGNIGVGKSTLVPKLVERLNEMDSRPWKMILEDVDSNPEFQRLLAAFTQDPSQRIAFQRFITNHRAELCKDLDPAYNYVLERSLYSDLVFCQANLQEACRPDGADLTYYYDIWDKLDAYPQVTSVVYLRSEPLLSYQRMLQRARSAEDGTSYHYIKLLSDCHDTFLPHICRQKDTMLLTEDWSHFGCHDRVARRILHKL